MARAALPFSPGLQIQAAQGEILLQEIHGFSKDHPGVPRIVLGDFNSWPGAGAHPVMLKHGLHEASKGSSRSTFVGFRSGHLVQRILERMASSQIDYIFGTPDVELTGYDLHHNTYLGVDGKSRNLSDHTMISADIRLREQAA